MEDEQVAGILQPGHAEAAVLREKTVRGTDKGVLDALFGFEYSSGQP
jgi:hypothetical protein